MLHLALSARVEMPPVSRKANVGFGEARSKTATPASALLEPDNITGCQHFKNVCRVWSATYFASAAIAALRGRGPITIVQIDLALYFVRHQNE